MQNLPHSNGIVPPSTDVSIIESFLVRHGIDIGFLVSGFFGALLLVSKNSARTLNATFASILAGIACANYLTPVAMSFVPESVKNGGKYAVAFVMGFMGLKGIEMVINKWFMKKDESNLKNKRRKSAKNRNRTKTRGK